MTKTVSIIDDNVRPPLGRCAASYGVAARVNSLLRSRSLRQGVVVLADQGIASLTTFVTGVLVARACGADLSQFGQYVFAMSISVTLLGFQRGFISLPFTVLAPRLEKDQKSTYVGSVIVHHMVACLLVVGGCAVVGTVLSGREATSKVSLIWIPLALAIMGRMTLDFVRVVLLADLRVWASFTVGLVAGVMTLAWLSWEYISGQLCVTRSLVVLAAGWAAPAVAALVLMRGEIRFSARSVISDFFASFRLGKWMVATDTVFMLSRQMIPWVLAAKWGSAELALLGACEGVAGLIGYTTRGMSAFFLPKLSHAAGNPRHLKRMLTQSMFYICPMAAACLVAAWLIGDRVMVGLYSSSYRGLSGPLMICCLTASIGLIGVPINQAVHALQRSDVGFMALVYSLPLSLCIGSTLTWRYGVWGACIASLLGVSGALCHRSFFLTRHLFLANSDRAKAGAVMGEPETSVVGGAA